MAVYTKINKKILSSILNNYDIGDLKKFEGIVEGVENTNYKITTSKDQYILTIFEKRVFKKDLPFFVNLTKKLSAKGFNCPRPIQDSNGKYIKSIKNKALIINSFLKGKKIKLVKKTHIEQIGKELAKLHKITSDLSLFRKNNLSQKNLRKIFYKIKNSKNKNYEFYYKKIEKELDYLDKYWPKKLPAGIIHADAFKDNVFFIKNKFAGLIDFYFSCNDFFAYELAITINAWCFNQKSLPFNRSFCKKLLNSYQSIRSLNNFEKNSMVTLLRGASLRFFLTRLHDLIFHSKNSIVNPKDPAEYWNILLHHQTITTKKSLGL